MVWKLEELPENGIMFTGQSEALVSNKRTGMTGVARLEYYPVVHLVGPVVSDGLAPDPRCETDQNGREILDHKPTFRN